VAETILQSDSKTDNIPDLILSYAMPKALNDYIKQWKAYIMKEHNGKLA